MKTECYPVMSEMSEIAFSYVSYTPALPSGECVGNVGNPFRGSYVSYTPRCAAISSGVAA